jgi:acyl transferase domain-containing protein
MAAIHFGCESLRRGETSLAIASGVNLILMLFNPLSGDDKDTVVLSKDCRCKTFDESKDYTIPYNSLIL